MLLSLLAAQLLGAVSEPPVAVFVGGVGGYPVYRIPAVVLVGAANGESSHLLAFAEGRVDLRDNGSNDIVLAMSCDGGASWTAPRTICDHPGRSLNNPCVAQIREGAHTGRVLLMFQSYPTGCGEAGVMAGFDSGPGPDRICRTLLMHSDDGGVSWSLARDVTREVKHATIATSVATGPGIGIQLRLGPHRGRILMPFNEGPAGKWRVYTAYSDDGGDSWKAGACAVDAAKGMGNEVQVFEREDGAIVMNSRSQNGSARRKTAISMDGGETFGDLVDVSELPDPSCMGGVLALDDSQGSEGNGAAPTTVVFTGCDSETRRASGAMWISRDGGRTWPEKTPIEKDGFAYSAPVALSTSEVGVLYEAAGYKRIVFARIALPKNANEAPPPAHAPSL